MSSTGRSGRNATFESPHMASSSKLGSNSSLLSTPLGSTSYTNPSSPSPSSSSSNLLTRPGHVFWHAAPSPSQQVRQSEIRKYLASNAVVQPLGSQAFRDELLKESHVNDMESKRNHLATKHGNVCGKANATSGSADVSSSCSADSREGTTGCHSRRFIRRTSRKSGSGQRTPAMNSFLTSNEVSQKAIGMHELLADLNKHLSGVDADADTDELMEIDTTRTSPSRHSSAATITLETSEGTCNISEHNRPNSRSNSHCDCNDTGPLCLTPHKKAGSSQDREWGRTKSLPSPLPSQRKRTAATTTRQAMSKTNSAMQVFDGATSTISIKDGTGATRKRTALSDVTAQQQVRGQESHRIGNVEAQSSYKTRSASSSASPTKRGSITTRMPRIGLSRNKLGIQGQSNSQQNGPSAPFKRPRRLISTSSSDEKLVAVAAEGQQHQVIVVEDSDDEFEERRATHHAVSGSPTKRSSPRKRLQRNDERTSSTKLKPQPQQNQNRADEARRGVTDLDSSMGEVSLQGRKEERRSIASTSNHAPGRNRDAASPNTCADSVGDESFEMESSDNEALLSAINSGQW